MALVVFTSYDVVNRELIVTVEDLLLCAASQSCSKILDVLIPHSNVVGVLSQVVIMMLSCIPTMTLLFSINITVCIKKLKLDCLVKSTKRAVRRASLKNKVDKPDNII